MSDRGDRTLLHWLWAYAALVVLAHLIINIIVVLWWPTEAPLRAWDVILGISTSVIVALVAGAVTIAISWRTSQHFGDESNTIFAAQLRQALATSVATAEEAGAALLRLLSEATGDPDGMIVLALSSESLANLSDGDQSAVLAHLKSRFADDKPTLLALTIPEWLMSPDGNPSRESAGDTANARLWKVLGAVSDEPAFAEGFWKRHSLIVPFGECNELVAVHLRKAGTSGYQPDSYLWAQATDAGWLGIRSSIDEAFARVLIDRLCRNIEEPAHAYGPGSITSTDVLQGALSGVQTTRSIITSQLLMGIGRRMTVAAGPAGTRQIYAASPAGGDVRLEFGYAPDLFLPPLARNDSHSGATLAGLLENGTVPLAHKRVWEVGCGPGYLTRILANRCTGGYVVAVDMSEHALRVARQNVDRDATATQAPVRYIEADCLSFHVSATSGPGSTLTITPPGSSEMIPIDLALVELPLLAYHGERALLPFETPYFESSGRATDSLLPPTLEALVKRLFAALPGTTSSVLVPLCASDGAERERIRQHLEGLAGAKLRVELLTRHSGFVHSFLIQSEL